MKGLVTGLALVAWMCGCGGETVAPESPPVQDTPQPALVPTAHVTGLSYQSYVSGQIRLLEGALGVRMDGALYLKSHHLAAEPATPKGFAPPGAPTAFRYQGDRLLVFLVGQDGILYRITRGVNGVWSKPEPMTEAGFAPPGAGVAVDLQGSVQIDVFVVSSRGVATVFYLNPGQRWGSLPLSMAAFAPPGARLATGHQGADRLHLFVVGHDGVLRSLSVLGGGTWASTHLTKPGFAPPGASLAVGSAGELLGVFVVNAKGSLSFFSSVIGSPWTEASALSAEQFAPPGAHIATSINQEGLLVAFVVDNRGVPSEFQSRKTPVWTGPKPLPGIRDNFVQPGASLSYVNALTASPQEAIFISSHEGLLLSTRGATHQWSLPESFW